MPFKGYKTITVAATFLLSVLTLPDVQQLISTYPKAFGTAVSVAMIALRLITSTPILQNAAKPESVNPPTKG